MALTKLTYQELFELLPTVLKAWEVPFIQGKPGVGKSALAKMIADHYDWKLIDVRLTTLDPISMNGFLWVNPDSDRSGFRALDLFPLEGDEMPINPKTKKPYKGFLVFFDEFTQPPKSVEGAAYRLILDREVADKKLHPKAVLMCAGNPQGQGMIAKSISTPMRSRIIHFEMHNKVDQFIDAAINELNLHPFIPTFLKNNPDMLNNFDENANNQDGTYACERTWEKLSNILKQITKINSETKEPGKVESYHIPVLVGTVGETAGGAMWTFIKSYYSCPRMNDIVADPLNATVPQLPVDQYAALAYLVHNVTLNNGDAVAKYIKRYNEEQQLIFAKMLKQHNEEILDKHFFFLTDLVVKYALAS